MTPSPSGRQIELDYGDQHAVVVEVGGGLRSYSVGEREILDGYGVDEICSAARGQPLIPWPNRVRDGRYEWAGQSLQLDITEPLHNNAIHGLVHWRNWRVREHAAARVVLEERLYPNPGYPFTLDLAITYELGDSGLTVSASATNLGAGSCPYGVGFHPYFRLAGEPKIDEGLLTLPSATRQLADERLIPYARESIAGTDYDFRTPRRVGDLRLDSCFVDLERDADGYSRAALATADGKTRTGLWMDATYEYLMVYSGETLAPADRRRGLAIEPMSCAPNAFQTGEGLLTLEPGETHTSVWGITIE